MITWVRLLIFSVCLASLCACPSTNIPEPTPPTWTKTFHEYSGPTIVKMDDNRYAMAALAQEARSFHPTLSVLGSSGIIEEGSIYRAFTVLNYGSFLRKTRDRGFVMVRVGATSEKYGSTMAMLVVSTNEDQSVKWSRIDRCGWGGFVDAVIEATDGSLMVAGQHVGERVPFFGIYLGTLKAIASDGITKWNREYDSIGPIRAISETSDGGFLLASRIPRSLDGARLAKVDSSGAFQWIREAVVPGCRSIVSLDAAMKVTDGIHAVAGRCLVQNNNAGASQSEYVHTFVAEADDSGNVSWSAVFDAQPPFQSDSMRPCSILRLDNGGYVLACANIYENLGDDWTTSTTLLGTNRDGSTSWSRVHDRFRMLPSGSAVIAGDGGFMLAGEGSYGATLMKTDEFGNAPPVTTPFK